MQLTQTLSEGLRRQYKVVVAATDLSSRFDAELEQLKGRVNLNGFRPGKVPVQHLKRVYGKSVMAEVVQNTLTEAQKKIVEESGERLAGEPKLNLPEDEGVIAKVLAGEIDLDFSVDVEVLPKVAIVDHSSLKLTREVAEVPDEEVETMIGRMAANQRDFSPRAAGEPAEQGDKVTIDFVGTINGVAFEGGTASGADLVLGSGQFIPGFEEQLVGLRAGDAKVVKVTFPETYSSVDLAGKAAEFAVTVQGVQAGGPVSIDDELAKKLGVESLEKLREAIKFSMAQEIAQSTRQKLKRQLLDGLDGLYQFELPPSMLEQEFQTVWRQVLADMEREGKSFKDDPAGEAEAQAEYRRIASRRVRLGLVLAEIGEKAEVKVTDDEVTKALIERAREFPGQEKMVFDFYRKNPQALAELRAPLFEEKVVDHVLGGLSISDKKVSRAQALALDEAPAEAEADAKAESKPAKAKKSQK